MSVLQEKHVVITGGDGALGQAVVRAFVSAGAVCHLPIYDPTVASSEPGVLPTANVDLTNEAAVEAYYASLPSIVASVHLAGGFQANGSASDRATTTIEGQTVWP